MTELTFAIGHRPDVRSDSGREQVEPWRPFPEYHRDGYVRISHVTLLQCEHGHTHPWIFLSSTRKYATVCCRFIKFLILLRCRTFPMPARLVSRRLPAYSFVLTQFKTMTGDSSHPSPESDDSLDEFLGFANPGAAPSSFVSTSLSNAALLTLLS